MSSFNLQVTSNQIHAVLVMLHVNDQYTVYIYMFLGFLWKNVSPFSQEQFFSEKKNIQFAATEYICTHPVLGFQGPPRSHNKRCRELLQAEQRISI